jgi:hypothetical protein
MNRRKFFRVSAAGAIALGVGVFAYRCSAPTTPDPDRRAFLDESGRMALRAIVPVMLGPVFSDAKNARMREVEATIDRVDAAIRGLSASAQREVNELFMLLNFSLARRVLVGIVDWSRAPEADVSAFLQSWRIHRLQLLQVAYHALHDLVAGSHYSDPSTWARVGFTLPSSFQ